MSSKMRRLARDTAVERRAREIARARTGRLESLHRDQRDLEDFGNAVDALAKAATREEVNRATSRLCQLYVALRCMALGMEPPPL